MICSVYLALKPDITTKWVVFDQNFHWPAGRVARRCLLAWRIFYSPLAIGRTIWPFLGIIFNFALYFCCCIYVVCIYVFMIFVSSFSDWKLTLFTFTCTQKRVRDISKRTNNYKHMTENIHRECKYKYTTERLVNVD